MPAATLTAIDDISATNAVEVVQPTITETKTRGLIQLKKQTEGWLCSTVIYGSESKFVPVVMNEKRVLALFALVNLGMPLLNEQSIIAEFFESEVSVREINEFGFELAA